MVATRRGVRVCSPRKSSPVRPADVQATPSTGRRTRSSAKPAENPTQHALVDASSHLENVEGEHTPTSPERRSTRASGLHSPELPSTPVGFVHEADMSDLESCSSAVSEVKRPPTGTRKSSRRSRVIQEDDDISEVESCSSARSASRDDRSSRRSLRMKKNPEKSAAAPSGEGHAKVNLVLEAESHNALPSELQRVTRSQRKAACTRLSVKHQPDSELSDADSYMSGISGTDVTKSTSRRVTRSRRQRGPIPIHLDEGSESSLSPAPRSRRGRASGGKRAANVDASESQSCDSEGFESGPTAGVAFRRMPKALDSDSEPTNMQTPVGSSCSPQSRGTPCSSGAGSGISKCSSKYLTIVLEKADKDTPLNDSILEATVIAEDADCTLLEGNENQTVDGDQSDGVRNTDPASDEADSTRVEKGTIAISDESSSHSSDTPLDICTQADAKSAVSVRHQQEELCDENKDGNTSEMDAMQETVHSTELPKPCHSAPLALCRKDSEPTEEAGAAAAADEGAPPQQRDDAADEEAAEQALSSEQDKMGVRTSSSEAQQVVKSSDAQVESIQTTSSINEHSVAVDSVPGQQPEDVFGNNAKKIYLLLSSDEEDEDEEVEEKDEGEVCDEEEEGDLVRVGEAAAAGTSVDGLFVIDTRPGQDTDQQYYMEEVKATKDKGLEEEEQGEDFVDEEGDDEDEDAKILFSSRNPLVKEMSSRIDPGIRMKELGGLYINFDGSKSKPVSSSLQKLKEKKIQDEVMKKSVIGPDFEKKEAVPPYAESKRALKSKRRVEREKSTGDGWFNMGAPELSQELKGDLQVLKMRGSLDPKRFYKKNDRDGFPKYFQVGTVVDSPVDFYHSRIPKKDRKRTMVDELLADAEFRHKNKKKYQQIISERAARGAGKRNKKRSNKVHKKKI
ncbi:deoxynucleotidyltransferase terminal-interacting protein 2 [Brachionichthys hirsutus]|uniref:deoxynucleotidyltransferase terminal-interacting protein 2 n=1 Tax=Brachionichthys hirsutus TaxID=412623 RepID=UPI003604DA71